MSTRNLLVLLAAAPLALPASAQQATPAPVTTVPPADSAVPPPITWSLPPGPGATPSAPAVVAPVRVAPTPRPAPTARATPVPSPRASATPRAAQTPIPRGAATPAGSAPSAVAAPVAAPSPSLTPAIAAAVATPSPTALPSAAATSIVPVPPPASGPPAPLWRADWLIAAGLILLGGVALLLWRRRRSHREEVDADEVAAAPAAAEAGAHPPSASERASPTDPASGAPRPASAAARARLALALRPRRGGINLLTATLDAELEIVNTGDAPADAIHVAARLLSAHRDQQAELDALFAEPRVRPAVAPFALAPGEARALRLLLTLPRSAIRPIDMGGRAMFVPVAVVDVRYASGAGEAQSAAAFAVGVERDGASKLAPFWLDAPARMHETLGARPHGEPVRR
ncbi:LPXTG cell wall anchor domain-containing protein [Sphingomonas sp. BK580]|uniref:LPXTG cell wall anchor domain-containing protein n=1 Tax=Sphingomonas sp. BK580 TaxID=2586972 RepID=UPI0016085203|nr:LPXTG cell wall anchor domain-containing protein [Sphingomonas sp. BK580]MBB3693277.1 LPXTG-motif cell wall-anchored protein [Sphingomonas sp. BK580]